MRRLTWMLGIIIALTTLLLARDIYADYRWAQCELAAMSGEAGPCTCGRRP